MKNSTYHVFFSNLANPLRISIIEALKEKQMNVSELTSKLKVEQSKISHALTNLKRCNLVEVEAVGKTRVYKLNRKTIVPILDLIDNHAKKSCCNCCNKCTK